MGLACYEGWKGYEHFHLDCALRILAIPEKGTAPDFNKVKKFRPVLCALGRMFRETEEPHLSKPPVLSYLRFEIIREVREVNWRKWILLSNGQVLSNYLSHY